MSEPSEEKLKAITEEAHIPAIGYAYVQPEDENKTKFSTTTYSFGKKSTQPSNPVTNEVNDNTLFPASSLSKVVFAYLVLQWAKDNKISIGTKLSEVLKEKDSAFGELFDDKGRYKRLIQEDGSYPAEADDLTIEHILSHTSGLPNVSGNSNSILTFNSKPGEKYHYSGEAIFFLQKVIEASTGKDLQALAQQYVFKDLGMTDSTFLPQVNDPRLVKVHSELGKAGDIYIGNLRDHAAGSLLTTANDFSKFMSAWIQKLAVQEQKELLAEEKDLSEEEKYDAVFKSAFEPPKGKKVPTFNKDDKSAVCGLGWHLCRDDDGKLIAYQYGENTNTRSFVAINVTDKKGAVFFTNCEHGMSIANQIFTSPDFAPIGDTTKLFKENLARHPQSDEPGWKETFKGKRLEDQAKKDDKEQYAAAINKARYCFAKAAILAPEDESKKNRLDWFNEVHSKESEEKKFAKPLDLFAGVYSNPWDECEMKIDNGNLVYEKFGVETKLERVLENDFLPETNQDLRICINDGHMKRTSVDGSEYNLFNQTAVINNILSKYRHEIEDLHEKGTFINFNHTTNTKLLNRLISEYGDKTNGYIIKKELFKTGMPWREDLFNQAEAQFNQVFVPNHTQEFKQKLAEQKANQAEEKVEEEVDTTITHGKPSI